MCTPPTTYVAGRYNAPSSQGGIPISDSTLQPELILPYARPAALVAPTVQAPAAGDYPLEAIPAKLVSQPASVTLPAFVPSTEPYPCIVPGEVDCLPEERAMVAAAYADLNKVLSSDLFEQQVLAAAFTETNGMSNAAIYAAAVNGSPIRVSFTMFTGTQEQNQVWRTMGYEDPAFPGVCFANRFFIHNKEVCGSLILHETMHLLGFSHTGVKRTSVPYTMNRIYDEVATALGLIEAQAAAAA